MKKSALGVSSVVLASLVACMPGGEHRTVTAEPRTDEVREPVLANVDRIMADALESWSRAPAPVTAPAPLEMAWDRTRGGALDEEVMRHDDEPAGTTTLTGAEVPAPTHPSKPAPTAPPRSAAEAAERNGVTRPEASPRGPSTATPPPMAPTSPAETESPFR